MPVEKRVEESSAEFRFARRTAQISVNYAADLLREQVQKMDAYTRKMRGERIARLFGERRVGERKVVERKENGRDAG